MDEHLQEPIALTMKCRVSSIFSREPVLGCVQDAVITWIGDSFGIHQQEVSKE